MLPPINFQQWIEEHRDKLKPPVGNQVVYKDTEFIIMVVGGPNRRKDFHINEGEEFFYQLEGQMTLRIMENGAPRDIPISAGEIFLLPPLVPHSPQREAGSVGLVVERKRRPEEMDAFAWYCESCHKEIYRDTLPLTDIVTQLPVVFGKYWSSEEHRRCKDCNTVMQKPAAAPQDPVS